VWGVSDGWIKPSGFIHDAFVMCKSFEACVAVIAADATAAYAAKGKIRVTEVHQGFINSAAAERDFF
jgi:hypothetical protein